MGTYCKWFVLCNADGEKLQQILSDKMVPDSDPSYHWSRFCYGKWSQETKWYPDNIIMWLSKKYPDVIFRVTCAGGYSGTTFYYAGKEYSERTVFPHPTFPPAERFAEIERETEEEAKREKEAIEFDKRYKAAMAIQGTPTD